MEHSEAKSSTFSNGKLVEHKEAKSSTFSDGKIVAHKESTVACAHGRCSKSMTIAKKGSMPSMTHEGLAAGPEHQSGFMRARLSGLIGWMRPKLQRQPTVIVTDVVETRPAAVLFLAPRVSSAQTRPQAQASAAGAIEAMKYSTLATAVCLIAAGGFLLTLIGSSIMMWRISESRELRLQPLSEPLAHAASESMAGNITSGSVVVEPKASSENMELVVKNYLEQMYDRAAERAHMTATKMYLSKIYAKACV